MISASRTGDRTDLYIDGRFDFGLHQEFRRACESGKGSRSYVVDLSKVEYIDSAALGMLLLLRDWAAKDQGLVRIVGCQPTVRKILGLANFEKLFQVE